MTTIPLIFTQFMGSIRRSTSIDTLEVLRGRLPRRALELVLDWAELHQAELRENWQLARSDNQLKKIAPWSSTHIGTCGSPSGGTEFPPSGPVQRWGDGNCRAVSAAQTRGSCLTPGSNSLRPSPNRRVRIDLLAERGGSRARRHARLIGQEQWSLDRRCGVRLLLISMDARARSTTTAAYRCGSCVPISLQQFRICRKETPRAPGCSQRPCARHCRAVPRARRFPCRARCFGGTR